MEMKKILKELEDLKFDSYDNIVNEVLDCIAKNQNELFETKTGNDLYKFVECIYLLLLEFDKKDAKHLFLHILGKYNIYFSLIGLESSLYLYKRKLELTKIESLYCKRCFKYFRPFRKRFNLKNKKDRVNNYSIFFYYFVNSIIFVLELNV